MTDSIDISKKVYEADDIQKLLGLGRTKTYEFLDEVFQKQEPFRVIKIGKVYKIPCLPFERWLYGEQEKQGVKSMNQNNQLTKAENKEVQEEKRVNITVRRSRQSGVARATCPD